MQQLHRLLSALALLCLFFPATAQQSINWNKGGSDYNYLRSESDCSCESHLLVKKMW